MVVFEERVNWSTQRKPLSVVKRTNKLNPHMTPDLVIEPEPHWWEASALTTVPSLHPQGARPQKSRLHDFFLESCMSCRTSSSLTAVKALH